MKCLELCSGTQSFSKVARERGHHTTTVDMNAKSNPDIVSDVRELVGTFEKGQFDFIWASPPCTGYSNANTLPLERKNLPMWDEIAQATLTIIEQVEPTYYVIENPVGMMRHRDFIKPWTERGLSTVSYCMYGKPYRKNTDLWNNLPGFVPLKCRKDCGNIVDNKHTSICQTGKRKPTDTQTPTTKLNDRYSIPPRLMEAILDCT